ncbi:glutaredoxin family protein [Neptunitalea lumnitzerae]|uniref:Glutaredoxin domain-containing protein n=1 Tax=Neptunitalea lumnitzerae TaxID=2965509 RepID=A0ABQ5MGH1_9FLAO|nr:glutaredoxin family protein [Neptunitalea sp. Y10]GLB48511.1 hypothetical protein Y10_08790 [Neptunitalea sp. Y10]
MKALYKLIGIVCVFFCLQTGMAQTVDATKNTQPIIVYGSNNCHYCTDTKDYLERHQIAYIFYDVDTDTEALQTMLKKLKQAGISLSNVAIPVIDKNGAIFMNTGEFEVFLEKLK